MFDTKFFLSSKTIIGAILTAIVAFAPLVGLSFSADDAQLVSTQIDAILKAIGILLVVWGRLTATTSLTIKPSGSKLNSPWLVSVAAALLFLAGCATGGLEGKAPLEKLRISYDSAKVSLVFYSTLPSCGPDVVGLCSKPEVVSRLNEASVLVEALLTQAEASAGGVDDEAEAKALRDAQNALRTLLTIYAVQALTKV